MIRNQQDEAYQMSLEADRKKVKLHEFPLSKSVETVLPITTRKASLVEVNLLP